MDSILFNQDAIREKFCNKIHTSNISLTAVAGKLNIPASTLSRFALDRNKINFDYLYKIAGWVGVVINADKTIYNGDTLPNVKKVIFNDSGLTVKDKERLWQIFANLYDILKEN